MCNYGTLWCATAVAYAAADTTAVVDAAAADGLRFARCGGTQTNDVALEGIG